MANLAELYNDRKLYSSPDMFSPPSERLDWVIRFELTTGCPYGQCSYCGGFDGIRFQEKSLDEYERHVDKIFRRLKKPHYSGLTRIFIGGGDTLAVNTKKLAKAISYTRDQFYRHTFDEQMIHLPKRIALYGSTRSITTKDPSELRYLSAEPSRLNLIYWGIESGSPDVLAYVNKGCTVDQIIQAGNKVNKIGNIDLSVMVMPGLGGIRFSDQHIEKTAQILGFISPRYITFMGVNPSPESLYARRMAKEEAEGTNRPLTNPELVEQTLEIIRLAKFWRMVKIGCFTPDIDQVGYNPMAFGSVILTEGPRKERFIKETLDVYHRLLDFNTRVMAERLTKTYT